MSVLKTVLTSSVGDHIAAFRALSQCSQDDIVTARKALREWIGNQKETGFAKLDDTDILLTLLEEFANFAIFMGEEIQQENARNRVVCGRGGNA